MVESRMDNVYVIAGDQVGVVGKVAGVVVVNVDSVDGHSIHGAHKDADA